MPLILGQRLLDIGQSFDWQFEINILGTTLYWCTFAGAVKHASFEVFWPEKTNWLGTHCTNSNCVWVAKDDGFYLLNGSTNKLDFVHPWS